MSHLAFYATPIDFNKNDKLNNVIETSKKNKLNLDMLKKLSTANESEVSNIHDNVSSSGHNDLKDDNDNILGDFYSQEMKNTLENKVEEIAKMTKSETQGQENSNSDYLISNNLNMNKIGRVSNNNDFVSGNGFKNNSEVLRKLNYIINMFEEERDIKTTKKNEEIVLYCFLGIFVIYVLDSFVYIGKYSR